MGHVARLRRSPIVRGKAVVDVRRSRLGSPCPSRVGGPRTADAGHTINLFFLLCVCVWPLAGGHVELDKTLNAHPTCGRWVRCMMYKACRANVCPQVSLLH